jgi:mannose-1-phosphate guanylyltransferase/mannose-6-phosphate isomerase
VSRQEFPKQLLQLTGDRSLLQQTALRLSGDRFAPAIIVSGEEQRFFIKRQLQAIGASIEAILLEPAGRNTAAAAALAASWLRAGDRDDLLLLMPSDHVIGDREAFVAVVRTGVAHAQSGAIVTFGAEPNGPNTQYGYIEAQTDQKFPDSTFPISRFHEKPDAEQAKQYLATGRFYWNAGIFLVKASALLDEMREFLPASLDAITQAVADGETDGVFFRPSATAFERAENISIDNAIMEKTPRGIVVPAKMDWSDVGAWDAVWKLADKDSSNNAVAGDVASIDTRNSLLRSDGSRVVAAVGLENMAVIAVSDAVFVAPLDRAADVKPLLEKLKAENHDCVELPAKVARPWGSYETVASGSRFQVKRIIVDPGERLSLQNHVHRSEHWVIVRGAAEVTVGDKVSILQENESTYIPVGTKHRLANPGKVPLELIEVQCGAYLGEDDITRFDDEYGRRE